MDAETKSPPEVHIHIHNEQPVTASKLESQYAPEEQQAQQAAGPVPDQSQSDPQAPQQAPSQPAVPSQPQVQSPPQQLTQQPDQQPAPQQVQPQPVATPPATLDQQLADQQDQFKQTVQKQSDNDAKFGQLLATKTVDPNHYLHNMGTGNKMLASIGLILGGVGSGLTGQPNAALGMLNKAIDNDIEAQRNDQSNTLNLWKMHHESLQNELAANLQTRNNYLEIAKSKVDEMLGNAPGPMAVQRAAALKGQLATEQIQNNFNIARAKLQQQAISGGDQGGSDPSQLVPLLVPEARQKDVFEEIKNAQDTRRITPQIIDAFKRGSSRNPNEAAQGQREFEGLINTTVKEQEGTARQAAFDSIHKNMTPSGISAFPGENKAKLRTVMEYLGSKSSAPQAKGFNIDLDKFQTTHQPGAENPNEGKTATGPNGQKLIMKQGKWVPVSG